MMDACMYIRVRMWQLAQKYPPAEETSIESVIGLGAS
jgi:hypothetical protein